MLKIEHLYHSYPTTLFDNQRMIVHLETLEAAYLSHNKRLYNGPKPPKECLETDLVTDAIARKSPPAIRGKAPFSQGGYK